MNKSVLPAHFFYKLRYDHIGINNGEKLGINPEDMACPLRSKIIFELFKLKEEAREGQGKPWRKDTHYPLYHDKLQMDPPAPRLHKVEKFNEEEACIGHKI